jgi:hypothetical protein
MVHYTIVSNSISPKLGDMDDIEWFQLLHPFSSVRTLLVSREFAGHISRPRRHHRGMATEVLSAFDTVFLGDQPTSSFAKFIATRWECGRPVNTVDRHQKRIYGKNTVVPIAVRDMILVACSTVDRL